MLNIMMSINTAAKSAVNRERYSTQQGSSEQYESFPLYYENLTRKIGRGGINDLACAYTAYLYSRNNR